MPGRPTSEPVIGIRTRMFSLALWAALRGCSQAEAPLPKAGDCVRCKHGACSGSALSAMRALTAIRASACARNCTFREEQPSLASASKAVRYERTRHLMKQMTLAATEFERASFWYTVLRSDRAFPYGKRTNSGASVVDLCSHFCGCKRVSAPAECSSGENLSRNAQYVRAEAI